MPKFLVFKRLILRFLGEIVLDTYNVMFYGRITKGKCAYMKGTNVLSVSQNIIWSSIGSFVYLSSQWVLTIIVTRMIGYTEAGVFSLAMSLSNVFYCIAIYGIRNFQISDLKDQYQTSVYIKARYLTCGISFFCFMIFVFLNQYNFHTMMVLNIYMLFKLSEAMVDVYHGIDQRYWRMDIVGKSFLIRSITTFVLFVGVLFLTKNLELSILCMAAGAHLSVFLYDKKRSIMLCHSIDKSNSENNIKRLLLECLPLVIYLFLSTAVNSIPRFFLEKYYGNECLGIFASVATPAVVVQVGASYIFSPLITLFAERLEEKEKRLFIRLFLMCLVGISLLSVLSIIGAYILKDWGLSLLFGDTILQYTYLFVPVIITTILTALVWFGCSLLTIFRKLKELMYINAITFVLSILGSVYFVLHYGMMGVNITLIVVLSIEIILLFVVAFQFIRKDFYL